MNEYSIGESLFVWIVILAITMAIFIVLREFWCWYWKINERIQLLKDIKGLMGPEQEKRSHEQNVRLANLLDDKKT